MSIDQYFLGRARATMAAAGAPDADLSEIAAWAERERAAHRTTTSPRSIIVDADGHIHAVVRQTRTRSGVITHRIEHVTDAAHDDLVGEHGERALTILCKRLARPVQRLSTASLTQGAGEGRVTGRQSQPQAADRMDPGELQAVREYLGLSPEQLASMLGVRHDTLRRWESGREQVPVRVREEVAHLEDAAADAVDSLVGDLTRDPSLRVTVYRTDEQWQAAHPGHELTPARWWRHVVMRALEQVDREVVIESVR